MPHVIYLAASIACPWSDCEFQIEMIDFQLELMQDPALYSEVMKDWGQRQGFGLVGRCPGCKRYVLFRLDGKQAVDDPVALQLPVLPDDWHLRAYVA